MACEEIGCFGAVITFVIRRSRSLQLPPSCRVSLSELRLAGSVDDLAVAALSFRLVGKKAAVLSEESLPVAGNILHPQVVDDEFLTPVRRETKQRVKTDCSNMLRCNHEI